MFKKAAGGESDVAKKWVPFPYAGMTRIRFEGSPRRAPCAGGVSAPYRGTPGNHLNLFLRGARVKVLVLIIIGRRAASTFKGIKKGPENRPFEFVR
tara:strand:- start:466 stop:753 length:288 start_codon:yes stop_codon:yes gene_type:complete